MSRPPKKETIATARVKSEVAKPITQPCASLDTDSENHVNNVGYPIPSKTTEGSMMHKAKGLERTSKDVVTQQHQSLCN